MYIGGKTDVCLYTYVTLLKNPISSLIFEGIGPNVFLKMPWVILYRSTVALFFDLGHLTNFRPLNEYSLEYYLLPHFWSYPPKNIFEDALGDPLQKYCGTF